jgi:hypothetical protein
MEREALKLALDALEESIDTVRHNYETDWRHGYPTRKAQLASMKQGLEDHEQAITAIQAALAKPAQEPVAWTLLLIGEHHGLIGKAGDQFLGHPKHYERVNVYTAPPKRTWTWLSDADIAEVVDTTCQYTGSYEEFLIKKAERKIRSMNNE